MPILKTKKKILEKEFEYLDVINKYRPADR